MQFTSTADFVTMKHLYDHQDKVSGAAWRALSLQVRAIKLEKDAELQQQNDLSRFVYFLADGVAREFVRDRNNTETSRAFHTPYSVLGSLFSYRNNTRLASTIAMASAGTVFRIDCEDFAKVLQEHGDLEQWYALTMSRSCLQQQNRLRDLLQKNHHQRLHDFLAENPELVKVLPARHIASYLNLPPVIVSIVRRKMSANQSPLQMTA